MLGQVYLMEKVFVIFQLLVHLICLQNQSFSPDETTIVPTDVLTPTINFQLHQHEGCLPSTLQSTSTPSVLWCGISPSEREELLEADASPMLNQCKKKGDIGSERQWM